MELLLRVNMTKQHDVTHDETTTTCLIEIAICALKKQSDVTTRRYYNDLFDRFVLHP